MPEHAVQRTRSDGSRLPPGFRRLGLSRFRLELLDDPPEKIRLLVSRYRELLDGSCTAARLIRELDVAEQLGTTEGTLRPR